jgi:hypothetical protein
MSPFYFALVTSVVVSSVLIMLKSNENKESNIGYGVRISVTTFIVSFLTFTYMGENITTGGGAFGQEIDIGEAPF